MLKAKTLEEKAEVGGGATGTSSVPDPVSTGDTSRKQDKKNAESMNKLNNPNAAADASDEADAGKNAASIKAKPSAANEEEELSFDTAELFEAFGSQELTEEFKDKVAVIFNAAVQSKLSEAVESLEEEYQTALNEAVEEIATEMYESVDKYLSYAVDQWKQENEVAIERSIRADIAESFMESVKNAFVEHYVSVPDEQLDVIAEMANQIEELENVVNEKINENIELMSTINEAKKSEVFSQVAEGLAVTQQEKLKTLAESVEFSSADSYKEKLQVIKENFFRQQNTQRGSMLTEQTEQDELTETVESKGPMAAYVTAIRKTSKV